MPRRFGVRSNRGRGLARWRVARRQLRVDPGIGDGIPLGDFRLIRQIGRGGMGVVYEAEQLSLGRRVALKVLPFASTLDAKELQRFKNEAQAAACLHHTNIVPIHAVGCERGVHFYAMQLIEGRTLATLIGEMRRKAKGSPLPPSAGDQTNTYVPGAADSDATPPVAALSTERSVKSPAYFRSLAELGQQVAEALDHAHEQGIIHRDIKPSNLMLDALGKVWVTDFGLAHVQGDKSLTMTGDLLGTLRYMSPEQALAKRIGIDHRTDIYSLGVTLYELLTLQSPFTGDDRQQLLRQIAFEEPRPPRRINKTIPTELETIVLKAMEKNPEGRYANSQELADDLGRFLEDKPIRARRANLVKRTKKWMRRHRPAVVAFLSVAFIGIFAIGTFLFERHRRLDDVSKSVHDSLTGAKTALQARDLSLARQKLAEAEGKLANDQRALRSLEEELEEVRAGLDAHAQAQQRFQEFMQLTTKASGPLLGSNLDGVQLLQDALSLYGVMDRTNENSAPVDGLLAPEQIAQLKKTIYQNLLVLADHSILWWWDTAKKPEKIMKIILEKAAQRSLLYLDIASKYHPPTRGFYWVRNKCRAALGETMAAEADAKLVKQTEATLGVDYFMSGRDAGWAKNYKEAIKQLQMALLVEPTHDWSLEFLAIYLMSERRYDEALLAANGLIAMRPGYADGYSHRAEVRRLQNRFLEALADSTKAIELEPNEDVHYDNRGKAYQKMGKLPEALADFTKAIALDPEDHKYRVHYSNRGVCLLEMGRFDEALADFAKALQINPQNNETYKWRGCLYANRDQDDLALADFNKALELKADDPGGYNTRGSFYRQRKQYDLALADFSKALELNADSAFVYTDRGQLYGERKQYDLALADFNKAVQLDPDARTYNERGLLYFEHLDQFDLALADYTKAIEYTNTIEVNQQEAAVSYLNRANGYCATGDYEKAVGDCSKAMQLAPAKADGYHIRSHAYRALKQYDKAIADMTQAMNLAPQDPRLANCLAFLLTGPAEIRDPKRALPLAEKALQADPANGQYLYSLARVYYRLGRHNQAIETLQKSLPVNQKAPKSADKSAAAEDLLFLAMANHQLGNNDMAKRYYQEALAWMKKYPSKHKNVAEGRERIRKEAETLLNKQGK